MSQWCEHSHTTSTTKLQLSVLTTTSTTTQYSVVSANFHPSLLVMLQEMGAMLSLPSLPLSIPPTALDVR